MAQTSVFLPDRYTNITDGGEMVGNEYKRLSVSVKRVNEASGPANAQDRQFVFNISVRTGSENDHVSIHGSLLQFKAIFETLLSETNERLAEIASRDDSVKEGESEATEPQPVLASDIVKV